MKFLIKNKSKNKVSHIWHEHYKDTACWVFKNRKSKKWMFSLHDSEEGNPVCVMCVHNDR